MIILLLWTQQRKVPYRALTRSLISAECAENPKAYRNEVTSGMLNVKVELLKKMYLRGNQWPLIEHLYNIRD